MENGQLVSLPRGDVQPTKGSTLFTVCPFILGNEFCERLAFYGLSTNLVVYLREVMGYDAGSAAIQCMLFEGTCYLSPLLGAYLADSRWGRYYTILIFSVVYMMGTSLLAASALVPGLSPEPWQLPTKLHSTLLYGSLYIIAVGTGGIKPNVSAFGADQFDETDPRDRKEKESFFNWFYFAINIGSLLAVTVVVYVQESIGWGIGFAIPAAAMLIAIVMFVAGSSSYVHVPPTESPFSRVFKVMWSALRTPKGDAEAGGGLDAPLLANGGRALQHSQSMAWLDRATRPGAGAFTSSQVEEVKLVLRLIPIFLTTICYWTIYIQMNTFFVEQGTQMDRRIGRSGFVFPAASLALFNTLSIIILIPLYDKGLVPLLRRAGRRISLLQRIGWGLVVAMFAMIVAGLVEWYRLRLFAAGEVVPGAHVGPDVDGALAAGGGLEHHKRFEIVAMSVFWQVPQYLLIGLSEVLTSIGQLEFFYDQAPDVMRSCSMALQLLSVCIGSYLSGALVWVVGRLTALGGSGGWLTQDLNEGRLDLFFYFMGALMAVGTLLFVGVAVQYTYKAVDHDRLRPKRAPRAPLPSQALNRPLPFAVPGVRPGVLGDADQYSRSVTFVPRSPALPAPLR